MKGIDPSLCARVVEQAAHQSTAPMSAPAAPNFDALAASFAALAVVVGWCAVAITALAIVVAFGGFAWGRAITREATSDAREEAKRIIDKWLRDEAPRLLREGKGGLESSNGSLDETGKNADDAMGEAAG